jgi:hypothetical protein
MNRIVLASESLLTNRYGKDAKAIIDALSPIATGGLVSSTATTAAGLRADLQPALKKDSEAAILLVGGATTLPFFELVPNPADDGDPTVPSDNPYGVPGSSEKLLDVYLPTRWVGRIPDHPGDDAKAFIARVRRLCGGAAKARTAVASYSLSTVSWKNTSVSIATTAGLSPAVDLAPTRVPADFKKAGTVKAATTHYNFNLHGSDRTAPWYGEDAKRTTQPAAVDPDSIASLSGQKLIEDSLALSQACYGAFLRNLKGDRTPSNAISLRFLEEGAAAFVGSTCIAYGASTGMQCSDIISAEFFKAALAGVPLGQSLHRARQAVVASAGSPPSGAALKTLLQFVLYGDPIAVWAAAAEKLEKKAFQPEDELPELGDYSRWREVDIEEKTLFADERLASDRAAGADQWIPVKRFAARADGSDTKPLAHGSGPRRDVMMTVRSLTATDEDGLVHEPVIYFREVVRHTDGNVVDVESMGGRSVRTTLEQSLTQGEPTIGTTSGWLEAAPLPLPKGPARSKKPMPIPGFLLPKNISAQFVSKRVETMLRATKKSSATWRVLEELFSEGGPTRPFAARTKVGGSLKLSVKKSLGKSALKASKPGARATSRASASKKSPKRGR